MENIYYNTIADLCTPQAMHAFDDAYLYCKEQKHTFITPEHIMLTICKQDEFRKYCAAKGIDINSLTDDLTYYLNKTEGKTELNLVYPSSQTKELIANLDTLFTEELGGLPDMEDTLALTPTDIIHSITKLENSYCRILIEEHLGQDILSWFNDLQEAYRSDIDSYLFLTKKGIIPSAIAGDPDIIDDVADDNEVTDNGETDNDEITNQDIINIHPIAIGRKGEMPIIAEAYINGKKIDMSSGELYKKLVKSAGRLMTTLQSLGLPNGSNADDAGNGSNGETPEPWEEMVTLLNDKYAKRNPLIGREEEMSRAIRILCRKDKNNPIFIGEPGVGKTAMIYGLTRKIVEGDVPAWLRDQRVYSLDLGSIVAGASYHGEFERRMKEILEGAKRKGNCILYIDEIHNIANSNGGGGKTIDASDLLKPYLEDGSVRFIGSTTYQDFNKNIASNKALVRRFGQIDIKEPSVSEAIAIVKGLLPRYERHHGVTYTDDAVEYAVKQSDALIHDRFLPDKAVDIIDEAGAYLQQHPLLNKKGEPKAARWQKVDKGIIQKILTDVCRIDAKALSSESNESLKDMEGNIRKEIYGQDEAIKQVVRAIMMSKAGLGEPDKPLASLLFVGPTGVGKTEVCKVLAKELGTELIRFDMSEYTEKHTISKLIGSPAGYIGYEEGGLLTDAIRKTPNCVLLLDEIEKAHTDIYNILLQVMDYARLTDNKGNKADFKNVVLIMTSNAGAQFAAQSSIGFTGGQSKGQAMMNSVKKTFKPEFLNRLSGTVVFNDMDRHMAELILNKKLKQLDERLAAKGVTIELSDAARQLLMDKGFTTMYGAREMDRAIQQHLTPLLMEEILFGKLKKGGKATIDVKEGQCAIK